MQLLAPGWPRDGDGRCPPIALRCRGMIGLSCFSLVGTRLFNLFLRGKDKDELVSCKWLVAARLSLGADHRVDMSFGGTNKLFLNKTMNLCMSVGVFLRVA